MTNEKFPKMTTEDKVGLINAINMMMGFDLTAAMAGAFQTLGKAVHDNSMTKDDLWDIMVGTYHSEEEYGRIRDANPLDALLDMLAES